MGRERTVQGRGGIGRVSAGWFGEGWRLWWRWWLDISAGCQEKKAEGVKDLPTPPGSTGVNCIVDKKDRSQLYETCCNSAHLPCRFMYIYIICICIYIYIYIYI